MAIRYDIYKNPVRQGEREESYHVRTVSTTVFSTSAVKRYIQDSCSLTSADVGSCLDALSHFLCQSMEMGARVKLDGIGSFGPQLEGEVVKTKKGHLKLKGGRLHTINYKPDLPMLRDLRTKVNIVKVVRPRGIHKVPTLDEIKVKLDEYFKTNNALTVREFLSFVPVSRTIAYELVKKLVLEGCLENIGSAYLKKS